MKTKIIALFSLLSIVIIGFTILIGNMLPKTMSKGKVIGKRYFPAHYENVSSYDPVIKQATVVLQYVENRFELILADKKDTGIMQVNKKYYDSIGVGFYVK